jgi:hypothetical protein
MNAFSFASQLKKFDVDENWVPYKLDVEVEMPDNIDLASIRYTTNACTQSM